MISVKETLPVKTEFKLLFDQWNRRVYNFAFFKTKSSYIAEEVVQRTFIKLWNNLNKKDLEISIEAQIFCITKSVLLDVIKQENKYKSNTIESVDEPNHQETPNEIFNAKELNQRINQQIQKLPKVRQQVFILSRVEQLSYKEISQKLKITTKTVENHINLALKQLKKNIFFLLVFILLFF